MKGRRWYEGMVELEMTIYAPSFEQGKRLVDYEGGVMDSLDGGHGFTFTYLPVVYQDDCLVVKGRFSLKSSTRRRYSIVVRFLESITPITAQ
jgi:hypothetical protein